jgi:hypothetical protein
MVIASKTYRKFLYEFCKVGQGFSAVQRRDAWLLATGALQLMISVPQNYYADLVEYAENLYLAYPS